MSELLFSCIGFSFADVVDATRSPSSLRRVSPDLWLEPRRLEARARGQGIQLRDVDERHFDWLSLSNEQQRERLLREKEKSEEKAGLSLKKHSLFRKQRSARVTRPSFPFALNLHHG